MSIKNARLVDHRFRAKPSGSLVPLIAWLNAWWPWVGTAMCRRLGPRETESRVPIYIGYDFRRGYDRSVAIGRESEIRGTCVDRGGFSRRDLEHR